VESNLSIGLGVGGMGSGRCFLRFKTRRRFVLAVVTA
jgi:hypothetical protein